SPVAQRLVIDHEEKSILSVEQFRDQHRSAKSESVLVADKGVFLGAQHGERIRPGVQLGVPEKFEQGPVEGVRAGLRGYIDLTGLPAEFSRINTSLHFELLDRIDRRRQDLGVKVDVDVRQ